MNASKRVSADEDLKPVAAIFDLDGTITKRDTYFDFLKGYMLRHPHLLARLPALVCAWALYAGKIRNNSWLKQTFLRLIAGGARRADLDAWADEFIARLMKTGLRTGALGEIEHHRRAGHRLIMATASFDFYVDRLAEQLGFDHVVCTRAVWTERGTLTGNIAGRNCYAEEKVRRLQAHFMGQRQDWYIHGYTDHHSDVSFLAWVDRPVAVNPTTKMLGLAKQSAFEIVEWDR
jgi:phosphatidylglycerophosphatase C